VINGQEIPLRSGGSQPPVLAAAFGVAQEEVPALVDALLGKDQVNRLGGVHRSTSAIVTRNNRSAISQTRPELAYFGTAYGVLELIDLTSGREVRGFVPEQLLPNLPSILDTGIGVNEELPFLDASPNVADAFVFVGDDTERTFRTVLTMGLGGTGFGTYALDITDPSDITQLWAVTDPSTGRTNRTSIARYRRERTDTNGTTESTLAYAAVASADNGTLQPGIQVHAYDLYTGDPLWTFSRPTSVDEIPGAAAVFDSDDSGFDNAVLVGDSDGRIWMLDVATGQIVADGPSAGANPLIDVGRGPDDALRPIIASPSIGEYRGNQVVGFGTGGADFTSSQYNFVMIYDLEDNTVLAQVDIGEFRLYSPVTFAGGDFFFTAVRGSLFSSDPTLDAPTNADDAYLYQVRLDSESPSGYVAQSVAVTKTASSVYVKNGQVHVSDFRGNIQRFGQEKEQKVLDQLQFLYWKFSQQ
jgi:outer membrane protein assembly factor BamB